MCVHMCVCVSAVWLPICLCAYGTGTADTGHCVSDRGGSSGTCTSPLISESITGWSCSDHWRWCSQAHRNTERPKAAHSEHFMMYGHQGVLLCRHRLHRSVLSSSFLSLGKLRCDSRVTTLLDFNRRSRLMFHVLLRVHDAEPLYFSSSLSLRLNTLNPSVNLPTHLNIL